MESFIADFVVGPFHANFTSDLYCQSFLRGAEGRDENERFQRASTYLGPPES